MSSDETTSPMPGCNTAGPPHTGTAPNPSPPTLHGGASRSTLADSTTSPATAPPPPTMPQRGHQHTGLGTLNTTPAPRSIFRTMLSAAIPPPTPLPPPNPAPPAHPSAPLTGAERSFIATLAWQGKTAHVIHNAFNTQYPADTRTFKSIQRERTRAMNRTGLYNSVQAVPEMEDDGEQAQRAKRVMDARDRHRQKKEHFKEVLSGRRTLAPERPIKQEDSTEGVAPQGSPLANMARTEVELPGMGSSTPQRALPPGVGEFQGGMQQPGEGSREIKQEELSESNQETGDSTMDVDRKED